MTNNALYLQETQRFAVKLHHFKAINIKLLCFEYELNVFASFSNGLIRILPKYAVSLIESFEFDRYNKGEVISSPF